MDFALSREQKALQANARRFASTTLSQVGNLIRDLPTPEARFHATRPIYEELVAQGFLRRLIPQPFGGEGTGVVDMAVVAEEFHAADVNVSLTMFANLLGLTPIFMAGTPDQQQKWIGPFLETRGAPLAALANSEPGGSANFDAAKPGEGTRTSARLDGEDWVINGRKQWVSSATGWDGKGADVLAVVCRTGDDAPPEQGISVICVNRPGTGLVTERNANSMGHRGHLTPRFRLEDVRVPKSNLVGSLGGGRDLVGASFIATAALVGVMSTGVMRAAFDCALRFAKAERRGGAVAIVEHQAVGFALADAKAVLEAARALSWRACWAADAQIEGAAELALYSKVWCSEAAVHMITNLMRVVGIDSYDDELPLYGYLQDAVAFPLFDGGNMGVRRRQLHGILRDDRYSSLATFG
ncbi:acyl-CoA dehydrogenase family protein (plasmid) [Rhizobium sp. CB3171]|uniref:acyl-CoA dehydrogenase family protein n=1 Tax=Rhizobium sp. CB3171 TaxID=3039157 RepID=UPI0024B0E531|nr:acyl-CoA dehydrogenase family protein [Rhizobium sp. CB3171]WFU06888.1 acyl-CoA dehydrogenase family protein [Rhizobium sp. CB3171]